MIVMGLEDVLDRALDGVSAPFKRHTPNLRFPRGEKIPMGRFASAAVVAALVLLVGGINGTLPTRPQVPLEGSNALGAAMHDHFAVDEGAVWAGALDIIRRAGKNPDDAIAGALQNLETLRHVSEPLPASLYEADKKKG
jgi:hypothetical protein